MIFFKVDDKIYVVEVSDRVIITHPTRVSEVGLVNITI